MYYYGFHELQYDRFEIKIGLFLKRKKNWSYKQLRYSTVHNKNLTYSGFLLYM